MYKQCAICGNEFKTKLSHFNRRKTCSKECMSLLYKMQLKGSNNPNYSGKSIKTCLHCNKVFIHHGERTYCSRSCYGKRRFGENYGSMTDDNRMFRESKEYKQWRTAVFKRDNFKCILCGATRNLNADHIIPFAVCSEIRLDINNGRTLCHPCHAKTETYGSKTTSYLNKFGMFNIERDIFQKYNIRYVKLRDIDKVSIDNVQ